MVYREYHAPIPITFYTHEGLGRGMALGIRGRPLPSGKIEHHYLTMTDDGPILVRPRDVLPE